MLFSQDREKCSVETTHARIWKQALWVAQIKAHNQHHDNQELEIVATLCVLILSHENIDSDILCVSLT